MIILLLISNYVYVCFKFAVDLPVMETKEIASDKLATAVIVSVLLLFVTIITAIVVTFAFIRKKYKQKGNKDFKEQEMDTNGQLQFENEDEKEFEVTSTCSEAKEIIPTSIGLTTVDEDKSVDDNNN